jgi:hypothetical protein
LAIDLVQYPFEQWQQGREGPEIFRAIMMIGPQKIESSQIEKFPPHPGGIRSVLLGEHDREHARRFRWVGWVLRAELHLRVKIDPMQARSSGRVAAKLAAK